jgi:hypothetical protein
MVEVTRTAEVFVELADTLVESFDVVDFLQPLTDRCVELLGTAASGLMLSDQRGGLQVMTAAPSWLGDRDRLTRLLQSDLVRCVL